MKSIGIHPTLKKEAWLYGILQRDTGYLVIEGKFDHLIPPGKNARLALPKKRTAPPAPFNGGGAAA